MTILAWYGLILMILSFCAIVSDNGKPRQSIMTGAERLITVFLQIPIILFFILYLFK